MKNIIVLVSGGGTNLQALIDAERREEIPGGKITCVLSSNPEAYALERAKNAGIPSRVLVRKDYSDTIAYSKAVLNVLKEEKADLIILAGFMTILDKIVTQAYPFQIINVHPALIPSFCGKGYYGMRVHEAALEYGVKLTGATVHFVNEEADAGAIILQQAVEILPDDTPEILQKRVMERAEWKLLPKAAALFCQGKIEIKNNKAYIRN